MIPVMFLGGPLDHTTREIERDETISTMPKGEVHLARTEFGVETYRRCRIASGRALWFTYILEGYKPPVKHLLHTMPTWAIERL